VHHSVHRPEVRLQHAAQRLPRRLAQRPQRHLLRQRRAPAAHRRTWLSATRSFNASFDRSLQFRCLRDSVLRISQRQWLACSCAQQLGSGDAGSHSNALQLVVIVHRFCRQLQDKRCCACGERGSALRQGREGGISPRPATPQQRGVDGLNGVAGEARVDVLSVVQHLAGAVSRCLRRDYGCNPSSPPASCLRSAEEKTGRALVYALEQEGRVHATACHCTRLLQRSQK